MQASVVVKHERQTKESDGKNNRAPEALELLEWQTDLPIFLLMCPKFDQILIDLVKQL